VIQLTFVERIRGILCASTTVYPGAATEGHLGLPTKRTNAQIQGDGSCGPLRGGMVLVLGEGIRVTDPQWVTWSSQLTSAVAMGPASYLGVTYLVKRYGSVVHLVHDAGVKLIHLMPGQAVEPSIGPRMPSQADTLVGGTLNLGGFGLGEVALSIQSPANLKRFISLMPLLQVGCSGRVRVRDRSEYLLIRKHETEGPALAGWTRRICWLPVG